MFPSQKFIAALKRSGGHKFKDPSGSADLQLFLPAQVVNFELGQFQGNRQRHEVTQVMQSSNSHSRNAFINGLNRAKSWVAEIQNQGLSKLKPQQPCRMAGGQWISHQGFPGSLL